MFLPQHPCNCTVCDAEREELIQLRSKKNIGWRIIETAPTDGTRILLRNKQSIADGWYLTNDPSGREFDVRRFVWPYIHTTPTHWRPLSDLE